MYKQGETTQSALYDETHAIMLKELLTFFKESVDDIESEVPYNVYGNRGSVDLVWNDSITSLGETYQILRMFELESRIPRLEELIRKLKDRMEYFPTHFEHARGLPRLSSVELFLILLSTKENWKVVNEYLVNFKSAFTRTHQVFPKDVMSKTNDPSDDDFYAQRKEVFLVFFNPLKVREIEVNQGLMITEEDIPFHRSAAFQWIQNWSSSTTNLQAQLDSIKPNFTDSHEFAKAYKEYINS